MKKIQLAALALVASMSMSAENTTKLRVWIGGEKNEYELSLVDSITFCTNTDDEPADPDAPLAGMFSVSADRQVKFSKGNLQYTQSTDTWAFAANQYEMLGTANVENSALVDKIDLFGWSGSTATAKWGISTSTDNTDYSGDFMEWGQNISDGTTPDGSGQVWRTLSTEEWVYLFTMRENAQFLWSQGTVNGIRGLIILPDNFQMPSDISWTYQANNWTTNTYITNQWAILETLGAVFLPTTGFRYGISINFVQYYGVYWSSSYYDSSRAYIMYFFDDHQYPQHDNERYYGYAVRLVQDL